MIQVFLIIGIILGLIYLVCIVYFFIKNLKSLLSIREEMAIKSKNNDEIFKKNREVIKRGQKEMELKREEFNRKYKM